MIKKLLKRIEELKKEYKEKINQIINPDNSSWDDIGFDGPQPGYSSVDEYMLANEDYDESQQTEMSVYGEFVEKLEEIEKEFINKKEN